MEGRKEGWVEAKAGLRIAYSNQKTLAPASASSIHRMHIPFLYTKCVQAL